ncbi:sugar ABC transporter ATP-binding protein [Angustibacter aerolatus]
MSQADAPDLGGAPVVEVRDVSKRFGAIAALTQVSAAFRPGEVHGLVGANGAGKSTLIKVLSGAHVPDEGQVLVDGTPVALGSPQAAHDLGLAFIHQELSLVPKFSVLQNMALGQWDRGPARLLTWRALRTRAKEVLGTLGLEVPLDTPAEHLSIADAWLVSIGRALVHRARLVAMDEPSASLSAQECRRLFGVVRQLAAGGVSVLYVSHRLDEVVDLCQTVTVFRDGRVVERLEGAAITRPALVRGIVGGEHVPAAAEASGRAPAADVEPALRVRGLQRAPLVRGVDLDVLPGEVVGLTGLVGSGRTEVARMVFGADQPDAGAMWIDGRRHAPRDVVAGIRAGVALVPEERRSQALFLQRSIDFNVNLPTMASTRTGPLRLLSPRRRRDRAEGMVRQLRIKTRSTQEPVQHLSGGNQQKVVMAKWLVGSCRVLLLDEPSRGVDVSARTEIYRVIREQAAAGTAVLVISSEYDELVGCDRVVVLREGRVTADIPAAELTESAVLTASFAEPPPVDHTQESA